VQQQKSCQVLIVPQEAGCYVAFTDGKSIEYVGQSRLGNFFVVARTKELGEYASELVNRSQQMTIEKKV